MPTNKQELFEVVKFRTSNQKTFACSDGTFTTYVSSGDQHFQDESGNWHNINTDLFDEADFDSWDLPVNIHGAQQFRDAQSKSKSDKQQNKLNRDNYDFQGINLPYFLKIPRNIRRGYSIGDSDTVLQFVPVGASPSKGYIDDGAANAIHYQDVWNDADIELRAGWDGLKELITLKTDRAPSSFSFEVSGPLADDLTCGSWNVLPAWLVDATGTRRDVPTSVRRDGSTGKVYLDLKADVSGLQYPIVIDPTTVGGGTDTFDTDLYASTSYPSNVNNAYLDCGGSGSSAYRTVVIFGSLSGPGTAGAIINSATLNLGLNGSGTGGVTIYCYQATQNWNGNNAWPGPTYDQSTETTCYCPSNWTDMTNMPFDVTKAVKNWFTNGQPNYGFLLKGPETAGAGSAMWTSQQGSGSYYNPPRGGPNMSYNWSLAPGAPTVTSPNGGENWNAQQNVTWTAATDGDTAQSALQYEIQLSTDNGSTWADIVSLTSAGATSYTYDFSSRPQSSTCLIRIRAYDGTNYGPWDQSNGVFTIQHDHAPTAPTNLTPANNGAFDRTKAITATWQYNDQDAGDSQSKFDLKWSTDNGTTWTEVDGTVTPNTSYTWAANTLPHGNVQWMVRTYDSQGLSSPWSAQAQFLAGDPASAPTITSPANNATIATANPVIQWSSSGQTGYELQVQDASGNSLHDESYPASTNVAETLSQYNLANNTSYKLALRIVDADGIWSSWNVVNVNVSYTPPAQPNPTAAADNTSAKITLTIINPTPSGSEPLVLSNDIYRRNTGAMDWNRVGTNVPSGSEAASVLWDDYAVASNQPYDYKVVAIGQNGTTIDSTIISNVSVGQLFGLWLYDVSDPAGTLINLLYQTDQKQIQYTPTGDSMHFAGRDLPVNEFGENYDFVLSAPKVTLFTSDQQWSILEELIRVTQTTLCLRDGRGKLLFGNLMGGYKVTELEFGYEVDIEFIQSSYSMTV